MNKPKNILFTFFLFFILILFSGWGTVGHRKINQHAPASFPGSMAFLKASWTILLADHSSDADKRKSWDPSEEKKHYIDIDDYPEFVLYGKIPQSYDSVCALHGASFVLDKGILPWATMIAFDSLKSCFQRQDWNKAGLFAADLGHYVADGHQPLHITRNYNGQYTNQTGIHSRYETHMIGDYQTQILYPDDSVGKIQDINGYIFSYLYLNYKDVDSLLDADSAAHATAGSTSSNQYYSLLWATTQGFTIDLFKRASYSLAALIYTAWSEAGSPVMQANAISELSSGNSLGLRNFPNPFLNETKISFMNQHAESNVLLRVFNSTGKLVAVLQDGKMNAGINEIKWNAGSCNPGIFYIELKTDDNIETIKAVLYR